MNLTIEQLREIMPNLEQTKAEQYFPHLQAAMVEFEINTPLRIAAFLAQLAHESMELKHMQEIASGVKYEGRKDLGNTQPGDGARYKGRGPIQLTGRNNYRKAGQALGLELEKYPHLAAGLDVAFRIAGWYWLSRKLNGFADAGRFDAITYRVNGGWNGKEEREKYYKRAKIVLGIA